MGDMLPTPRYKIGDTVWRSYTEHTTEMLPCPDCLGTQTWKVITPAGTEMTAQCQRCENSTYLRSNAKEDIPSLSVRKWMPRVRSLTIGSILIDTSKDSDPVEYMCRETGIGSGSVYYESTLYSTREEALACAEAQAAAQTEDVRREPSQLTARKLAKLTVTLAAHAADWDTVYNAWAVARWHADTLE
jgi:hypothetical protein